MKIEDISFIKEFIKTTTDCYTKGWNERNGGNLTYRLTQQDVADITPMIKGSNQRKCTLGVTLPNLANEYFFITGSGKFFRNVCLNVEENCGLIRMDETGANYEILWGLNNNAVATSELPSHLMSHSVKKEATSGSNRVILHSHTTNIIALTFVLPLETKVFTKEIWEMITECPIIFPTGVGVVEWMVPGSPEIAKSTCEMMKKHDVVVWAHHGMFCSGDSLDLAFGLMDTVEKAAEILVKVISMGGKKQTIKYNEFKDIARDFKVDINFDYLK